MVLGMFERDLVWQAEMQELMDGVEYVSAPVAEGSHAEVVPAAPVALMEEAAIVVVSDAAVPSVPVHSFGDGVALGHLLHVPVVLVPTPGLVHVGGDRCDILDNASLLPCLELEIVGFGVALVAHLRGEFGVTVGHLDEELALLEGADEGLLAIDVLAGLHSGHADEEMGVVGHTDGHGVELVGVLVEELTEVGEPLSVGVHSQHLLALFALKVNVAQRHDVHHAGLGELLDVLLTAVADADVGNLHFVALGSRGGLHFLLAGGQHLGGSQSRACCKQTNSLEEISSC